MYGQLQNFLTGFFLRIPNELRLSWDFSMDSTKNFYKDSTSNSSRDLFKGYPSKLSTYCLTNENSSDQVSRVFFICICKYSLRFFIPKIVQQFSVFSKNFSKRLCIQLFISSLSKIFQRFIRKSLLEFLLDFSLYASKSPSEIVSKGTSRY